jgi:type II secretory pathway pseudopilin PulG
MTLLELLVGLTVTGMAVSAGVAALATLGDRRQQADAAVATIARAAEQREEIASWIAGARLVAEEGGPQFRGLDGLRGSVPRDEIAFLTTSNTPLGSGENIVRLYVDADTTSSEQGLVATFSEWRGTRTARVQLDPRVAGMEVRYLSGVLGGRQWLPSWISSTVVPVAVEVRLLAAADDSLEPLLRIPIVVPLRGGR